MDVKEEDAGRAILYLKGSFVYWNKSLYGYEVITFDSSYKYAIIVTDVFRD